MLKLRKKIRKFLLKKGLVRWVPNIKRVEIELTTMCSLVCFNCDRNVRQASSSECISLEQIEKFVNESIESDWKWKWITLIGGEPTLHPQFFEVIEIIKQYKDFNPECYIEVATNGYGSKVKEALSKMPEWINIRNSEKNSNAHEFSSYNMAPIDFEMYKNADFSRGCWVTETCGLGLTRNGFYPCGAGGSVDRVFGFNIGQKNLASINYPILREQLKLLCKYCGHFKENYKAPRISEEKMSASWQKACEKYKNLKPALSLY